MSDDPGVADEYPKGGQQLLYEPFDRGLIAAIRHSVAKLAEGAGLRHQRLDDFILAVNEIMTNAVRYAGGGGMLTLSQQDGQLQCTVSDDGPGIPPEWLRPGHTPPALALSGRGLWLARRLCDDVKIRTSPHGTTVLLAVVLPN